MKIKWGITFILPLLFIGCYSTYSIKNFPSRKKLYNNFNDFAKNKSLKVVFNNDSTFRINNGAIIENDILYTIDRDEDTTYNSTLALNAIKEINYTGIDYKSANIFVKNGKRLKVKDIQMIKDSVEFTVIDATYLKTNIASIYQIKEVNYKNRWIGIIPGFLFGTITGIGAGLSIALVYGCAILIGKANPDYYREAILLPAAAGPIIGILTGWLLGNNVTYEF